MVGRVRSVWVRIRVRVGLGEIVLNYGSLGDRTQGWRTEVVMFMLGLELG